MTVIGTLLLIVGASIAFKKIYCRILFWRKRREFVLNNKEYIDQLAKSDAQYRPEEPDIEAALRCREYLAEVFPDGISEKLRDMSKEEVAELFREIVAKGQEIMDVELENVDFYSTEEPPACDYSGYYRHFDKSLHINMEFVFSGDPKLMEAQVYTIFHELKHARQWAAIKGWYCGSKDYGYSNEQIRIWAENLQHYIPNWVSDELYRKQPVEDDAYGYVRLIRKSRQFGVLR